MQQTSKEKGFAGLMFVCVSWANPKNTNELLIYRLLEFAYPPCLDARSFSFGFLFVPLAWLLARFVSKRVSENRHPRWRHLVASSSEYQGFASPPSTELNSVYSHVRYVEGGCLFVLLRAEMYLLACNVPSF